MYKEIMEAFKKHLITFRESNLKIYELLLNDDSIKTWEEKSYLSAMFAYEMAKIHKSLMQEGLSHKDKIHMRRVYLNLMKWGKGNDILQCKRQAIYKGRNG